VEVIDVDAISSVPPPLPSPAQVAAQAMPAEEVIDVDEQATWAGPPSSAVAVPATPRTDPQLKFDGVLGAVLHEQKMEVLAEDAEAATTAALAAVACAAGVLGMAAPGASSAAASVPAVVGSPSAVVAPATAGTRPATLGEAPVVSELPPSGAASPGVGSIALGASATPRTPAVGEAADPRPRKVARLGKATRSPGGAAVPTVQRGRSRSKWDNKPRHPRKAFVRRAAVMSVVPRMIARPPTPPPSGSESGSGSSASGAGAGAVYDDSNEDASDSDTDKNAGDNDADENAGDNDADNNAGDNDGDNDGSRGADDASLGAGGDDDAGGNVSAIAADTLAWQLAARSRNQTLFPAACWIPGAHAVLAAARVTRDGLPPVAPVVTRGSVPAQGNPSASTGRAATPPPPPAPPSQPAAPAALDGESSDEMDDDELVMAYVTPPASPAPPASPVPMAMPTSSPFSFRPSSGRRRRANDPRGARAVASTARDTDNVDAHVQQSDVSLRDVYDAMRNGFSSVRREITRLRAEVVIVKSQAASTLRRMDGLAAAADGRDSRTGVVLGRLGDLDRSLRELGSRVPNTVSAAAGGQDEARKSLALVTEIKVRSFIRGLIALGELPACRCHGRGPAL